MQLSQGSVIITLPVPFHSLPHLSGDLAGDVMVYGGGDLCKVRWAIPAPFCGGQRQAESYQSRSVSPQHGVHRHRESSRGGGGGIDGRREGEGEGWFILI